MPVPPCSEQGGNTEYTSDGSEELADMTWKPYHWVTGGQTSEQAGSCECTSDDSEKLADMTRKPYQGDGKSDLGARREQRTTHGE